jgi:hypothetical protein
MKQCEQCKNQHDGKYGSGRFCSSACARCFSTAKARKFINAVVSEKMTKNIRICSVCGASAARADGGTASGRRCSLHKVPTPTFETVGQKYKKKFLIEERGHRCEDCKGETWKENKIPLQMHHKDGNPINDVRENLMLLCPNCHTFTDTFCGKNTLNKNKPVRERVRYK